MLEKVARHCSTHCSISTGYRGQFLECKVTLSIVIEHESCETLLTYPVAQY